MPRPRISGVITARSGLDKQYCVGANATDTSLISNPTNEPVNGKAAFCYAPTASTERTTSRRNIRT
jgi:hypothetical protein